MAEDPFHDVRNQLGGGLGGGCLGGAGLEEHYRATSKIAASREGMDFQVACDNCGQPNKVTISWDELIYGVMGIQHPAWRYDSRHRALYPNVGCGSCRGLIMLTFTPDECDRHLRAGINGGCVTLQYVQRGRQALAQQAAQQARR